MITETNIRLLSALPRFRKDSPNDCIALEKAARELIPEAKHMTHGALYETIVHPALIELAAQKVRAGTPVRATVATSNPSTSGSPKPRLDVSAQPGRNRIEKLIAHVKQIHPEASHDRAFTIACDMNRTHDVID